MSRATGTTCVAAALGTTAAILAPMAFTLPALAVTTMSGCAVTAGVPYHAGANLSGARIIHRQITFTCEPGRSVAYESSFFEQDIAGHAGDGNPDEDHIETHSADLTSFLTAVVPTKETVTLVRAVPLPVPDETDGGAELYQTVRFRVTSKAVQGGWSSQEFSAVGNIQL